MLKSLAVSLIGVIPITALADPQLLMAEEHGCYWCETWNEEIGPIYPKTAEGKAAPLVRYDIHGDAPDVEFAKRVHFTPTFILVDNGKELGRIEGYPGEDFFWGLLSMLFEDAKISLDHGS